MILSAGLTLACINRLHDLNPACELRGSVTILIVSHNLALARRLADDVAVFWNRDGVGFLEEQGTADAVFASPRSPISAAYLGGARG